MDFDIAYLAADRTLTQIKLVSRARETAVLGSRHECNKAIDRRKLAPIQRSLRRNVTRYVVNEFSLSVRCLSLAAQQNQSLWRLGIGANTGRFFTLHEVIWLRLFVAPPKYHRALLRGNRRGERSDVA